MFSDFLRESVYQNTVRSWLVALAIVVGAVVAARLFYFISSKGIKRLFGKKGRSLPHIIIDMLEEPLSLVIVISGFYYAQRMLVFPQATDELIGRIILFTVILTFTWALARLTDSLITQYVVPLVQGSDSKLDDQLLPILQKGSKFLIWTAGSIAALDAAGYNVATIVAGLGIGGLAFAFAAQETIANFFGGVTIFIDSPFRINDRIKISGYDGWVREIGLRTAKLETLDGRRLTIPNSFFSKNVIENVSSEPATRVITTIGLDCGQKQETVEKALGIIRTLIAESPDFEDNSVAYFKEFADSAYNIGVVLWIRKGANYYETQSLMNMAILAAFEREEISLALPTRIVMTRPAGQAI